MDFFGKSFSNSRYNKACTAIGTGLSIDGWNLDKSETSGHFLCNGLIKWMHRTEIKQNLFDDLPGAVGAVIDLNGRSPV